LQQFRIIRRIELNS